MDGSSGILDNAREIKMRMKAFGYVFRMTNDSKWVDRAWIELQVGLSTGFANIFTSDLLVERSRQRDPAIRQWY